ncbi:MAG: MBL fold metallo-hydrolase [Tannerella sp.]|jgi:L-ascorbate metabolism protein UlaG (beta-lactamase superfamily)|nr:MBL fold metallo-hydrolase [Tannerella sp.]
MKLTYIYHSGFVLEGNSCTLIIDYFRDTDDLFVQRNLPDFKGPVYVLVSHWHPDHFNKDVLKWKEQCTDMRYIFSEDILGKRLVQPSDAHFLSKGEVWEDGHVRIQAFGSTDVGISFLIEAEGKKIFHAGDLNNWHWSEESTPEEIIACERDFLKEVDLLSGTTKTLDLAMFPVDPRQGKDYMLGAAQFVDRIQTQFFVPMHFSKAYIQANAFEPYATKAGAHFVALKAKEDSIIF